MNSESCRSKRAQSNSFKKKKSYLKIKLSPIDTMNIDLYDLHGPILISLGWFYFESLYHKENLHKI